ncbi:peptidoglycan DD-metalloendopeptidase family protein [Roseivirga thermotolerans]|uniref:peptidoglycan DD-metalloendopeptidase family protein n=1 Tax=Roseivirga thermotolerans TaxID=1758176 RepID=UPI00273ED833|nr:peptidoglycan DD-metalloendopeptidase family protein [Roseivirga thermotolerans]
MTRISLILSTLLMSFYITAQDRIVRVDGTFNPKSQEYVFEAKNLSTTYYTVVVKFNRLYNLRSSTSLPFIKAVPPGNTKLFELSKDGYGDPDYSYSVVYWKGTANPKVEDVLYALPVSSGIEVGVKPLQHLAKTFQQETPENFYAIGFSLVDGDTIRAARQGVVEEIQADNQTDNLNYTFTTERNYIRVRHEDGTVARYTNFKNNSALIEVGEELLPGDPMAIATQTSNTGEALLMFRVTYLIVDPKMSSDYKEWSSIGYVTPKFITENHEGELKPNKLYKARLTDDIITQEMSKRERKKYLSGKR